MTRPKQFAPEALAAALKQAQRRFRHRPEYTGADIGYRWRGGNATDQVVVRVHVRRKLPAEALGQGALLPAEIDGIPLDVMEGDHTPQSAEPASHRRGLPFAIGGVSCGRADSGPGTLGLLVLDRSRGWPGLLSNWHVLAGPRARPGDPILQPGRGDPGGSGPIGHLERWMLDHDGDAAVARLAPGQVWVPLQLGIFTELRRLRVPRLGETLTKSGRTTGVTRARIDGIGAYRIVFEIRPGQFEPHDIQGFRLVPETPGNPDNIEISSPGDSGAIWCHADDQAGVGLHVAGEVRPEPEAEHAIACHLDRVLDRLNLDIASFDDLPSWPDAATQAWGGGTAAQYGDHPVGRAAAPAPAPYSHRAPTAPWQWPATAARAEALALTAAPTPRTPMPRPAHRFDRLPVILSVLAEALAAASGVPWAIEPNDPVAGLTVGPGNPHATLAHAITRHAPFRDLWLPGYGLPRRIVAHDIQHCVTYQQVCGVIDDMIEGVIP